VVVNYTRFSQEAEQVVQQIKAEGSEAIAIEADVTEEDQVQAMFHTMFDRYGSIDILVNNMDAHKDAAFTALTLANWEYVLKVNLTGQFLCAREAAREFIRRGVVSEPSCSAGKIICLSSVHHLILEETKPVMPPLKVGCICWSGPWPRNSLCTRSG
jgi:glucose 1-dehydrogenase